MRCIFCGRDALVKEEQFDEEYQQYNEYYAYCPSCNARGPKFKDKDFAILTWTSVSNIIKANFHYA